MSQESSKSEIVSPSLYDKDYYLADNEGFLEYQQGLDKNTHDKFKRVLTLIDIKPGQKVLDIGCGRGEMIYYSVRKGASALGIDYSQSAAELARQTIQQLPVELRKNARVEVSPVEEYPYNDKYDYIFMVETAEHMYDWQLTKLFAKLKSCLTPNGVIILTTPNYLYERYFQPVKRFLDIPFKFFKLLFRIPRGKYKPESIGKFFKDVTRIKVDRGERHVKMHCNVSTPRYIKEILKDFEAKVYCLDHSAHPLSLLVRPWLGREIMAVARLKTPKTS